MKNAVYLTGHVLVSDIVMAFEPMLSEELLLGLDKELEKRRDDRITFDDCEVLAEEAIDALDEADKLHEPEDLTYLMDQGDVQGLAEAIRCGERERAEMLLDAIVGVLPGASELREWVERGRYSSKARAARVVRVPRGHTSDECERRDKAA